MDTILVVDDHPINRLLIQSMLSKDGWNVVEADSAVAAMALLEGGLRPAVILMDIRMPVHDGFHATKQIRDWENINAIHQIPIIALTATTEEQAQIRATEVGMNGYIFKPVTLDQLRSALATALLK